LYGGTVRYGFDHIDSSSRPETDNGRVMRRLLILAPVVLVACGGSEAAPNGGDGGGGTGAVQIIRGDPNWPAWFSLVMEGHGLAADEGRLATARIGMPDRPPERLGAGQVRIEGGAFRIEFPQGVEWDLYKRKLLFIDVDGDGSCTAGVDRVYADFSVFEQDMTLTLGDSVPAPAPGSRILIPHTGSMPAYYSQASNSAWPES
jgi:hypothetical protein